MNNLFASLYEAAPQAHHISYYPRMCFRRFELRTCNGKYYILIKLNSLILLIRLICSAVIISLSAELIIHTIMNLWYSQSLFLSYDTVSIIVHTIMILSVLVLIIWYCLHHCSYHYDTPSPCSYHMILSPSLFISSWYSQSLFLSYDTVSIIVHIIMILPITIGWCTMHVHHIWL
jgi:hypothetical protein